MSGESWDPNRVYECSGEPKDKVRRGKIKRGRIRACIPDPDYHDVDAAENYLEARAQVRALMGKRREP